MANILDRFTVRLYYGDEADEAVGKYLAQFDSAARGEKHNQAKKLLYLGLQTLRDELEDPAPTLTEIRGVIREELALRGTPLDEDAVSQTVTKALQEADLGESDGSRPSFTLGELRQVMEAVLDQRQLHSERRAESDEGSEDDESQASVDQMISRGLID